MSTSIISSPWFHNEEAAYEYVEAIIWPNGPVCPHCGSHERISKMQGKSTRIGVYKCYVCRKPFTVKVGTVFEDSHIPLRIWLQGIYLVSASKKGISSNQLSRTLGITLKSAWFMSHRIRKAMAGGNLDQFGLNGGIVEADETYVGGKGRGKRGRGSTSKTPVFSLVERNGRVRSKIVDRVTGINLKSAIRENVHPSAVIMTDDFRSYRGLNKEFAEHHIINHTKKEYVKGMIHTNTIEGYFSILKRGVVGVYHHVSKHHLHRYLSEFDFRYNNRIYLGIDDTERADILLAGIVGKRLTYQRPRKKEETIN
jgi:transposase-like protein